MISLAKVNLDVQLCLSIHFQSSSHSLIINKVGDRAEEDVLRRREWNARLSLLLSFPPHFLFFSCPPFLLQTRKWYECHIISKGEASLGLGNLEPVLNATPEAAVWMPADMERDAEAKSKHEVK